MRFLLYLLHPLRGGGKGWKAEKEAATPPHSDRADRRVGNQPAGTHSSLTGSLVPWGPCPQLGIPSAPLPGELWGKVQVVKPVDPKVGLVLPAARGWNQGGGW